MHAPCNIGRNIPLVRMRTAGYFLFLQSLSRRKTEEDEPRTDELYRGELCRPADSALRGRRVPLPFPPPEAPGLLFAGSRPLRARHTFRPKRHLEPPHPPHDGDALPALPLPLPPARRVSRPRSLPQAPLVFLRHPPPLLHRQVPSRVWRRLPAPRPARMPRSLAAPGRGRFAR